MFTEAREAQPASPLARFAATCRGHTGKRQFYAGSERRASVAAARSAQQPGALPGSAPGAQAAASGQHVARLRNMFAARR